MSAFNLKFEKKTNPSKKIGIPLNRDQFNHLVTWKEYYDERTLHRMFADICYRYEENEGYDLDAYEFKGIFVGNDKQD